MQPFSYSVELNIDMHVFSGKAVQIIYLVNFVQSVCVFSD